MPPTGCGMCNEDLECLGCGVKLGCVEPGHCYAVEGKSALKKAQVLVTGTTDDDPIGL